MVYSETAGIVWVPYGIKINGEYYTVTDVIPPSHDKPYWTVVQGDQIMHATGEVTVFYRKGGTLIE